MRKGAVAAVPSAAVTTQISGPTTRRKAIEHPGRFAIVAGGLTLVAVLFAGAIMTADTKNEKSSLPGQVASVSPKPGSIVPPQEQIAVDLRDDLTADIQVCGPSGSCVDIPADQVSFIPALGQLAFRPGEGREIESFEPGRNTVNVSYRSQADPGQDTGRYSWVFVSKS
jgi:hypothetical protein